MNFNAPDTYNSVLLQLHGATFTKTVLMYPSWHKQFSSKHSSHHLFSCQDTPYWYPATSPELHMTSAAWELAKLHGPNPQSLLEQICWHHACARGQEHLKSHNFFGSLKSFCCPVFPLPFSLICKQFSQWSTSQRLGVCCAQYCILAISRIGVGLFSGTVILQVTLTFPGFGTKRFLLSHQMPSETYFIQTDSLLFFVAHFQNSFLLVNASLRACCCCAFLNTYPNVISIISKLSDSLGIA